MTNGNGVTNGYGTAHTNGHTSGDRTHIDPDQSMVYILSAKDSLAASQMNKNLASYLHSTENPLPSPTDLAFTLAERKSRFPWTTAVCAKSLPELADKLADPDRKPSRWTKAPRLGFVFNGQGAQWHAMGRELIARYPVFRKSLLEADQILKDYGAEWSLHGMSLASQSFLSCELGMTNYSHNKTEELLRHEKTTRVHEIRLSQPLSVALQLCLVDLLASWDVVPSAVTSHSSGEIAAAYSVGALTFRQALGVVYFRGDLAQKHKGVEEGAMLAAGLGAEAAIPYIKNSREGKAVIACHNSPESVTISGDMAAVDEVAERLIADGIFARKLNVPLAYHSHHMHAMAQDYTDALHEVIGSSSKAPRQWSGALFASPVTGGFLTSPKALTAEHFVRNLVSPVLFAEAFEQMCFADTDGTLNNDLDAPANVDMILEIGAHGTLSGPIRQILKSYKKLPYASVLTRKVDAVQTAQDTACTLLCQGYPVALAGVNGHENGRFVSGLPKYAWNHTTPHWAEPRVHREYRQKRFRPHELLGSPIDGTNRQTPRWRSFIRISDIPWLVEHKLGGDVVLPGAGYVAMAIEAARLLTDPSEATLEGYRLREVEFLNALTVPDTHLGVEVQVMLSPVSEKELEYKGWYNFEVWSVVNDTWIQHCRGSVTAETARTTKEAVTKFTAPAPLAESFFSAGTPVREITPDQVFSGLRSMNLFHGPPFQNLLRSRATSNKSITALAVSPAAVPAGNTVDEQLYVLHPTTLDSLIQAGFVSIPDATRHNAMAVPRSIRHLYVPRNLSREAGETITAFVDLERADRRGATLSAVAVNGEGNDASASRLELDGLYCQAVPLDVEDSPEKQDSSICSQIRWEVDVTHGVIPPRLRAGLQSQVPFDDEDRDFEKKLDRVSFNFISDAVQQLANDDDSQRPPHLQQFYEWMQAVVARGKAGELGPGSRVWARANAGVKQKLADDLATESAVGQLMALIGPLLADIVRGTVNAEEVLKKDDLLERYYEALPRLSQRSLAHLHKLVVKYAVMQPGVNVLEIGGRSGAVTAQVLDAFAARAEDGNGTLLGHYDFTDVVAGRFDLIKQKSGQWSALMDYKTLDIQKDPVSQGFVEGAYDLIVVGPGALLGLNGAPSEISSTLANMRRLLKPDGKLMLVENTRARLDTLMVFGGLPNWWQSGNESIVSVENWDKLFKTASFSGVEVEFSDCVDAQYQATSVVLTTAASQSSPSYPTNVSIIYADNAAPSPEWLEQLKGSIVQKIDAQVTVENVSEVQAKHDVVYLFTPEMTTPFLETMQEAAFEQLKELVVHGQGLVWLSRSSVIESENPIYGQSAGFLRTAKQEDTSKRYVSLDFEITADGQEPWSTASIPHIVQVLKQSFDANVPITEIEWEYAVKHDILHVPRVYPSPAEDHASSETPADPTPVEQPLWQPERPLVWETMLSSGSLSNLYFTDDLKAAETSLPSGYVEIQTQAMGLNFRDVLVALGQIDDLRYMHDAAGIVTRLGPDTEESGLKVGDRVSGLMEGRFATNPRSRWPMIAKMPGDMSFEQGASLPCIFVTSYLCLFDVARLQPGERVLIHAGAGGVGQTAIMLAQHAGAEVFATCSSEAKRQLLMEQYGLDTDHILSSRDASFVAAIQARTGGAGVDVVINSLSGPLFKATWNCMARFGRFVEIGKVDMVSVSNSNTS